MSGNVHTNAHAQIFIYGVSEKQWQQLKGENYVHLVDTAPDYTAHARIYPEEGAEALGSEERGRAPRFCISRALRSEKLSVQDPLPAPRALASPRSPWTFTLAGAPPAQVPRDPTFLLLMGSQSVLPYGGR